MKHSFQIRSSSNLITLHQLGLLAQDFTQKVRSEIASSIMEESISIYFAISASHMWKYSEEKTLQC